MRALWFVCDLLIGLILTTILLGSTELEILLSLVPLGFVLLFEMPRGRRKTFPPITGCLTRGLVLVLQQLWACLLNLRQKANFSIDASALDQMEGVEFERLLARYWRRQGWKVTLTKASGDHGADLLCEKGTTKMAIQAKRYAADNTVGNKAVQEAYSGAGYYGCNHAVVITTSYFTKSAREAASRLHVGLWDRDRLLRELDVIDLEQIATPVPE